MVQTVNAYLMPALVAAFAAQYPHIGLHVEELTADEIEQRLDLGSLQVGIGFTPPTHPQVGCEALFVERLALVVRSDHHFAGQYSIATAALHEMPMIMLAKTFCTRRLWEENARLIGVQPRVVLEMNTVSGILSAVAKTGLPTILPHLVLKEAPSDALVSLDLHSPTLSRQVGLLWHGEYTLCSASRAFLDLARQLAAAFSAMRDA